jgi:predicted PurR-regulated permease PerM
LWTVCARALPELVLIFSASVIAEGARPPVEWLQRRGLPRVFAILCILFLVVSVLGGLGWLIFAPLVTQVAGLIDDVPHFVATAQHALDSYQLFLHDNAQARALLAQMPSKVSNFLESKLGLLIEAPLFLVGVISNTFLLVLIAFFWLTTSRPLAAFTIKIAGAARAAACRGILDDLSTKTGGYVRGVLINMLVIGILSFSGVALLGVPYALLLGVVAALTESIPIVGPLLGGSAAVLVAALAFGPQKALEVCGSVSRHPTDRRQHSRPIRNESRRRSASTGYRRCARSWKRVARNSGSHSRGADGCHHSGHCSAHNRSLGWSR